MRGAGLLMALLSSACASTSYDYAFSDDVIYGWRCDGDRTFVAVERGDDSTALIMIGTNRYLLPFASQDRTADATTHRNAANNVQYELRELTDVQIANIDRISANLTGVPEGDFSNCRADPTVAS